MSYRASTSSTHKSHRVLRQQTDQSVHAHSVGLPKDADWRLIGTVAMTTDQELDDREWDDEMSWPDYPDTLYDGWIGSYGDYM